MIVTFIVLAVATSALAAPRSDDQAVQVAQTAAERRPGEFDGDHLHRNVSPVAIVSQTQEFGADGAYNFSFESADGTRREEAGYLKHDVSPPPEGASEDDDGTAQVAQGSFSYVAPDGTLITLNYIADENGFRAEGDHLPKASAPTDGEDATRETPSSSQRYDDTTEEQQLLGG